MQKAIVFVCVLGLLLKEELLLDSRMAHVRGFIWAYMPEPAHHGL